MLFGVEPLCILSMLSNDIAGGFLQGWRNDFEGGGGDQAFQGPRVTPSKNEKGDRI